MTKDTQCRLTARKTLALTIGLLGKSCLLREGCLGGEGRLLEAAAEAGRKTVGGRGAEACRHAQGRSAEGRS